MKKLLFLIVLLASTSGVMAQRSTFEEYRRQQQQKFQDFRSKQQQQFDEFRKAKNEEFASFLQRKWEQYKSQPQIVPEEEKPQPPVVYDEPEPQPIPDNEPQPAPAPQPRPVPIDEDIVVLPDPSPQPEPVAPIVPEEDQPMRNVAVPFYGTTVTLAFPNPDDFHFGAMSEENIFNAWNTLIDVKYDVTIVSALKTREDLNLCDWAYVQMLQSVTDKAYGKSTNEASFMLGYLLVQSGYKVRFAYDESAFYVLVASQYEICNMPYFELEGDKFYPINGDKANLYISGAAFETEKSLQLQIASEQRFTYQPSDMRTLTSTEGVSAQVCVNTNNIEFYNHYPTAIINGDFGTRWASYANTPLESAIRQSLYPQLQQAIEGKTPRAAVNTLLNWVQTAFVYEYDDKVWGEDRAFFATETLFYPYCDCEDRSILFSRLVRDLLDLDVVLLYYPGHLATAVCIPGELSGDYLSYRGKDFTVCDPTYIGAPVGHTMPNMDNATAKVIVLGR